MNKIKALAMMLIFSSINTYAQEEISMKQYNQINEATMIKMKSKLPDSTEFEIFLVAGGKLVKQTEPDTKIWFALKGCDNELTIFDAFYDNAGRNAHFAGKVAEALKNNSDKLVLGGWEKGVLKNIANSKILSSKLPKEPVTVGVANYIEFTAKQGKADELAALLSNAAELVNKTEPKTAYWIALQLNDNTFAIFDAFSDEEGQKAHFTGKVAMTLKDQAESLLQDGWEKGVLSHVQNFKVITNV
ncbi:putative quinol monooxygenase [Legionella waltersii]|uniref:Antibiotic biosynthesis monooxygenase n=1 Tax=Legionella waltersii TaxID=66969 RepID=A0A0W1A2G3_9GAMM|nr:hypothetical protein [Legionella waltersii]KTD75203.1 hypothetical protein Lwal_3244 [Legionella waltersii]SNV10473.1 Uncharacterised protein [Legionella waltersii]